VRVRFTPSGRSQFLQAVTYITSFVMTSAIRSACATCLRRCEDGAITFSSPYYEQVQGVFVESADTLEGSVQHRRVDKESAGAPAPEAVLYQPVIARSITLSSEEHKVTAKLELAEFAEGKAVPVDYKHGHPKVIDDGYEPWPADRVQLAVQALVLRANGYRCEEGVIYYAKSR
jgi:CRISP-associated protein Cas1